MAGCGLPRTNPRAPSFSLCCSPTVRRLLVLHEESNPTTSRLVRASDADEIIDDRIDILRLDRCFVGHARVCHRRKPYISFRPPARSIREDGRRAVDARAVPDRSGRARAGRQGRQLVLILANAASCSWTTTKAILIMQSAGRGLSQQDLDKACMRLRTA